MATHIVLFDKEELKSADMQAEVGDPTIPGKLASTVVASAPTQGATDIVRPSWPGMTNPGNRPVGGARPKVQFLQYESIAGEEPFTQTPEASDPWEHASLLLAASHHSPFYLPPTQRAE